MNSNNLNYDDYCRILGDVYFSAQAQRVQFQAILDKLNEQVAHLQKENRELRESCNIPKENI